MEHLRSQLSHYFWSLNKWEAHMQTVVIPTPFTWFGCKYPQIKADSLQFKAHLVRFIWNPLWWLYRAKMFRIVSMSQYLWTWLYIKVIWLISQFRLKLKSWSCISCNWGKNSYKLRIARGKKSHNYLFLLFFIMHQKQTSIESVCKVPKNVNYVFFEQIWNVLGHKVSKHCFLNNWCHLKGTALVQLTTFPFINQTFFFFIAEQRCEWPETCREGSR